MGQSAAIGQNTEPSTRASGLRPPWQPGQSGNPGGRPKTKPLTEALLKLIDPAEWAALVWKHAQAGDGWAVREIADRIEGKPVQAIEDITPERLRAEAERLAKELAIEGGADAVIEQYHRLTVVK